MKTIKLFVFLLSVIILSQLYSCVPMRKFEDVKAKRDSCESENVALRNDNRKNTTQSTELSAKVEQMTKQLNALQTDTMLLGTTLRKQTANYQQINDTYNLLLNKNKELLAGNVEETRKILVALQKQQESLQRQEDKLRALEDSIEKKKQGLIILSQQLIDSREALKVKETEVQAKQDALNRSQDSLAKSQAELQIKQARLIELENILSKKDSTVKALKEKVVNALVNFQNNGLTVEQRNGKVYVSMDEKLLFQSGSYTVDIKGVEALKNLAKVLETNNDVSVLVEGHTDNVPYKGTGALKDNWDLSVLRATSVVKIILENSTIKPMRLSAAGRSQFVPLNEANTPEARSKNRRTEIILTPKLDELLKVMETN